MRICSKHEIEESISKYFGGVEYSLEIEMSGKVADIRLWYKDFKPSRNVREYIGGIADNIDNVDICRDYSSSASCRAIYGIISEHPVMYVDDEGELKPVRIADMINWYLFDKEL